MTERLTLGETIQLVDKVCEWRRSNISPNMLNIFDFHRVYEGSIRGLKIYCRGRGPFLGGGVAVFSVEVENHGVELARYTDKDDPAVRELCYRVESRYEERERMEKERKATRAFQEAKEIVKTD